eukprot:snap_masked-scaffold_1-processed-gene-7.28-mRNA-1 protein AED:1.00 eAED:1.00 QI:0/0/0/0/1/1/3/0/787
MNNDKEYLKYRRSVSILIQNLGTWVYKGTHECDSTFVQHEKCFRSLKKIRKLLSTEYTKKVKPTCKSFQSINIAQILLQSRFPEVLAFLARGSLENAEIELKKEAFKLLVLVSMPLSQNDRIISIRQQGLLKLKKLLSQPNVFLSLANLLKDELINPNQTAKQDSLTELFLWLLRNMLTVKDYITDTDVLRAKVTHNLMGETFIHTNFLKRIFEDKVIDVFEIVLSSLSTREISKYDTLLLEIYNEMYRTISAYKLLPNQTSTPRINYKAMMSSKSRVYSGLPGMKRTQQSMYTESKAKKRKTKVDEQKLSFTEIAEIVRRQTNAFDEVNFEFLKSSTRNLLDETYAKLFTSLKRKVASEKLDEEQLLWFFNVSSFCLDAERLNLDGNNINITKKGIFVSMDIWSFKTVLKHLNEFHERKETLKVEICLRTLNSMLQMLEALSASKNEKEKQTYNALRSSVFYDIDFLNVVFILVREYSLAGSSKSALLNLVTLLSKVLFIVEDNSTKGTLIRKTIHRSIKVKEKNLDKAPKAELEAFVEVIKQHQDLLNEKEQVLEQLKRDEILNSWSKEKSLDMIQKVTEHENVEDFIASHEDVENKKEINQREVITREVALQLGPWVRKLLNFQTVYNIVRVLDPQIFPTSQLHGREVYTALYHLLLLLCKQGKGFLWHVVFFDVYRRYLKSTKVEVHSELKELVEDLVKSFFEVASSKNGVGSLAYVEILFWRQRTANLCLEENSLQPSIEKEVDPVYEEKELEDAVQEVEKDDEEKEGPRVIYDSEDENEFV